MTYFFVYFFHPSSLPLLVTSGMFSVLFRLFFRALICVLTTFWLQEFKLQFILHHLLLNIISVRGADSSSDVSKASAKQRSQDLNLGRFNPETVFFFWKLCCLTAFHAPSKQQSVQSTEPSNCSNECMLITLCQTLSRNPQEVGLTITFYKETDEGN